MWNLRRPIFQKYKSTGQRYANRPENVPDPAIWIAMVDEWLKPEWQDQSKRNISNQEKSTIVHNTGSFPMAKYQKDEVRGIGRKS
ncbi:PREDICTED: LOC110750613 [Prunus dulcis]|uniref:PREDICTED: LOC110750613 n=1 Tax=Prunus dulcis TaxID=3755 RepID=A0A5E4FG31_PRUDU|nr:PREDICTED: LOC110750613 [Prunus dulcis]